MCCFSRPVDSVTATKIFARGFSQRAEQERQFIVYSMNIRAREELAMVLPIPIKPRSGDAAVRFVNLKDYATFFDALQSGFPEPPLARSKAEVAVATRGGLTVHEVGEFQASFVPITADFSRLDKRFRLPAGIWEKLPQYRTYGFAVFKLKPGAKTIHPMAFSFPRANPKELFLPTVHIHDGKVHPTADFDHVLYCQRNSGENFSVLNWRESPKPAKHFVDAAKSQHIVDPDQHCYRAELHGKLKNADTALG